MSMGVMLNFARIDTSRGDEVDETDETDDVVETDIDDIFSITRWRRG
jgi:hypothetical protein